MNWRYKSFLSKILSQFGPIGKDLYFLLQSKFGGFKNFAIDSKIDQGLRINSTLSTIGYSVENKDILEIGTGWVPILPLLFGILGQRRCTTVDIDNLLKVDLTLCAAKDLAELGPSILEKFADQGSFIFKKNQISILNKVNNIIELFENSNLEYLAPIDPTNTDFADETFDFIFSNTTLEHIPKDSLSKLFSEMKRVLKNDGVMAHLIDTSDHYSHSDHKISAINFLQYSEYEWKKHNNPFLYQNRLRLTDYIWLAEDVGLIAEVFDVHVDRTSIEALKTMKIHHDYTHFSREEMCSTSFILILKKQS